MAGSSNSRKIMSLFEAWDANGDGLISEKELANVFNIIGSDVDVCELLKEADLDADGQISYAEFVDWMGFDDAAIQAGDAYTSKQEGLEEEIKKLDSDLAQAKEKENAEPDPEADPSVVKKEKAENKKLMQELQISIDTKRKELDALKNRSTKQEHLDDSTGKLVSKIAASF